ncbi:MAG: NAD(P)H-dependent oxidoreductase [Lentimicrobiaceae bacterium]|nr:NAD(P)H-dependent oxidoreductase [Lentimicrobiaceae bacterium]
MKHIVFIIGSLRKDSFNRQLAMVAESLLKDRFVISYLDFENIPYFNQDLESSIVNSQQSTDNSQCSKSAPESKSSFHRSEDGELEAGCRCFADSHVEAYGRMSLSIIRQQILDCDGIWVFTPEYNRSYPGLLKNLFDWLSRPMDISNPTNATAVQGKKITVSGAGGNNKTASCREKLNELLRFIKMDVMTETQTGIALGKEAWTNGEFKLTDEQLSELKTQAEKFAEFVQ